MRYRVESGVALFESWTVEDNGGGWDASLQKYVDGFLGRLVPVNGEEEVKGALVGALDLHAGENSHVRAWMRRMTLPSRAYPQPMVIRRPLKWAKKTTASRWALM